MMIYCNPGKSKKKLQPKKVREQHEEWCKKVGLHKNMSKPVYKTPFPVLKPPIGRETPYIPSLNPADMSPAVKKEVNVYTGTKMIGIGTLHKSNAVPVFSEDEAKDMASMRR